MYYSQLSSQDAKIIDNQVAIVTENLNKFLQHISTSTTSGVMSDVDVRIKDDLIDALDILKRYKEAYESRCETARKRANEIPMFDGMTSTWSEFWSRFKYFVGDSPLPPV